MQRSDVERLAQIARQQWADSRGAAHGSRIRAMCSEIWDLCEAVLGQVERPDRDSPYSAPEHNAYWQGPGRLVIQHGADDAWIAWNWSRQKWDTISRKLDAYGRAVP